MCLLTFMHAGCLADIDHLRNGAENNPDGFGFAVHAGTHIVHGSGLRFDEVLDRFLKERANHNGPALFHSRITTHGGTTFENCHPFQVGRDQHTVVAHNGMLPIKTDGNRSDTRIFAETLFPSWGGASTLNSKRMRKKLSKFADGSKLVFLSANPDVQNDYYIINEKDGHWDSTNDGVWWSNSSYKWSTSWKKHTTYGTYEYSRSYAWDLDGDEDDDGGIWIPAGATQDMTYVDPETGEEVWGELWTCLGCGHEEYVNQSTHNIDYCDVCDSCWYCSEHRRYCFCYVEDATLVDADAVLESAELSQPTNWDTPSLWGYDKSIEQGSYY